MISREELTKGEMSNSLRTVSKAIILLIYEVITWMTRLNVYTELSI